MRALIALALVLSVPLIALALLAAAVVVWAVTGDRGVGTLLGLVALLGTLPGLTSLRAFGGTPRRVDAGARIDSAAEPVLSDLVAEEFRALDLAPPEHLEITLDPRTQIAPEGNLRTLVLGAPLIFGVRERAVRVAVAHAASTDRSALARLLRGRAWRVLETAHYFAFTPFAGRPWRTLVEAIWRVVASALRRDVLLADAACARRFGRRAAAAQCARSCTRMPSPPIGRRTLRRVWTPAFIRRPRGLAPLLVQRGGRRADQRPGDGRPADGRREHRAVADDRRAVGGDRSVRGRGGGARRRRPVSRTPLSQIEAAVLRASDAGRGAALVEVDWARAGAAVWLPRLQAAVAADRDMLAGRTIADLRELARNSPEVAGTDPDRAPSLDVLGAALAVALVREGWTLVVEPGEELRAAREEPNG